MSHEPLRDLGDIALTDSDPGGSGGSADDPRVILALEEHLAALEGGRLPDRQDLLSRYADVAPALARCLDGLDFVQTAAPLLGGPPPGPPSGLQPSSVVPGPTNRLGDYLILREVGRGGMGVVYEAEQISLGRRVALKVLPSTSAPNPRQIARFRIEAQAAALLHHPHIVPVFAVGCEGGLNFYAMQFIEGRTLASLIREFRQGGPLDLEKPTPPPDSEFRRDEDRTTAWPSTPDASSGILDAAADPLAAPDDDPLRPPSSSQTTRGRAYFRAVARLGIQAAEALDHAHVLGVLHRDIKPANLMVDSQGDLWVTDFGLARLQSDSSLTMTGDLLGTLRYMSPEQTLAKRAVVDHRTDIYSLGATLYELLTLRPVFDGQDRQELLRQVVFEEPRALRRLDPSIPIELETIVQKAIAKEPAGRYATAGELADDLHRYLDDKPILARRASLVERAARWSRRHKAVVATAITVLMLAATVGASLLWLEKRQTFIALQNAKEAQARERKALELTFASSDAITMRAMENVARSNMGGTGGGHEFYLMVLEFYDAIARRAVAEPDMKAMAAAASYRAAFTRMVLRDPKTLESYRRSIALYKELIAESPQELDLLRSLAEALSYMGYYLKETQGLSAAESTINESLELDRKLANDYPTSPGFLIHLANAQYSWSVMLEDAGRPSEAKEARGRLERLYAKRRAEIANSPSDMEIMALSHISEGLKLANNGERRQAIFLLELGQVIDPTNPKLSNDLAWILAIRPDVKPFEPQRALDMARRAVKECGKDQKADNTLKHVVWNTLGMALVRNGRWREADEALKTSMSFYDGDPNDGFLHAISQWRQGKKAEARRWYDKALVWKDASRPPMNDYRAEYKLQEDDLNYLRAEATALLSQGEQAAPDAPPKN